jgi:hypothetical protein
MASRKIEDLTWLIRVPAGTYNASLNEGARTNGAKLLRASNAFSSVATIKLFEEHERLRQSAHGLDWTHDDRGRLLCAKCPNYSRSQ